jgi:hypothetical protein
MSETTVEELVAEAKSPAKFNILSVLQERAYPTDEVTVYLDEETAYLASIAEEEIKAANVAIDKDFEDEKAQDKLEKSKQKLEKLIGKMSESKYIFTIKGIPEGRREELLIEAEKQYPIEYDENKNPFTGEVTKSEKEDRERNRLFTNMLWSENIEKITAPDGAVQEKLSPEDVKAIRASLPLASIGAINQAIEKIRAATAVFLFSVDEDFLAKS